ncbi:hypothetical protein TNCV_3328821 [Trichonephila clavipes]|nr:hypothetical protein TNCV_3328821 [Trichonephila clavipes]
MNTQPSVLRGTIYMQQEQSKSSDLLHGIFNKFLINDTATHSPTTASNESDDFLVAASSESHDFGYSPLHCVGMPNADPFTLLPLESDVNAKKWRGTQHIARLDKFLKFSNIQ